MSVLRDYGKHIYVNISAYLLIENKMLRKSTDIQTELKELTAQVNSKHQQCQAEPAKALFYAYAIGNLLLKINSILPKAEWQRWLKECCSFSEVNAQTYMIIAKGNSGLPIFEKTPISLPEKRDENGLKPEAEIEEEEVVITRKFIVDEKETDKIGNGDNYYQSTEEVVVVKAAKTDSYSQGKKTEELPENSPPKAAEKSAQYVVPQAENKTQKSASKKQKQNPSKTETNSDETSEKIIFYIPGNVVPKARPRVTSNGTYLPPTYRKWRNMAEVEIYRQILDLNISKELPIKKAAISLSFCGKHRTNSDLDNMAGACLDALTLNGAGVLKDDRLSCIPQLNVEYIADDRETGVWITIRRID